MQKLAKFQCRQYENLTPTNAFSELISVCEEGIAVSRG